jgi:transcriptional regulator GlxA family with amidase domain
VTDEPTRVAIFAFDGMTALDLVGPYEALSRVPDLSITICAETLAPIRTGARSLGFVVDATISQISRPDVLVIPGGGAAGVGAIVSNQVVLAWIREAARTASWTSSVCTGSLILGAAGLLDGRDATTHWTAKDFLARFGANYLDERVVESDRILTSAGVSAGIELGLRLVEKLAGIELARAVELSLHYDPKPPYGTGSPSKADPESLRLAIEGLAK